MYLPHHFEESRLNILIELIKQYSFGSLITHIDGELDANHLPFEYDAQQHVLLAHIAKENPLYHKLRHETDALVVFHIDQAYVSPNWYAGKFEHHRAVPTWNYVVIHVKGKVCLIEDQKKLRGILAKLTRHHEASQSKPWKMTDAPEDYIQDQLEHIVGLKIDIKDMMGKFKLSQNRSIDDAENVAQALSQQGKSTISNLMFEQIQDRAK